MAHTYDTKAETIGNTNPLTLSFTCGSGATILVLCIKYKGSIGTTRSGTPTYNGISLTLADTASAINNTQNSEIWYLLVPPTGGAYTISIPNSQAYNMRIIASSYKAASGKRTLFDASNKNTGSTSNPSVPVTTNANGDVIVDSICCDASITAAWTLLYTQKNASGPWAFYDGSQYALQATAGNISFGWTGSTTNWAMVVAAFKEAAKETVKGYIF